MNISSAVSVFTFTIVIILCVFVYSPYKFGKLFYEFNRGLYGITKTVAEGEEKNE